MPESPTLSHYVFVIHGTWNRSEEGTIKWYQLDTNDPNNFCHRLQQALSSGPLQDSVWRQCSVDPVEPVERPALAVVAAYVGSTRLIDNAVLNPIHSEPVAW